MKLRNKKTGEIKAFDEVMCEAYKWYNYSSLSELNEEWEDYEEPKDVWWLDNEGNVNHASRIDDYCFKYNKQIGNYFGTKEEAEKALEKLKAWKRLKDNGFRFQFWSSSYSGDSISFFIDWINADSKKEIEDDLDLLFGGEE